MEGTRLQNERPPQREQTTCIRERTPGVPTSGREQLGFGAVIEQFGGRGIFGSRDLAYILQVLLSGVPRVALRIKTLSV